MTEVLEYIIHIKYSPTVIITSNSPLEWFSAPNKAHGKVSSYILQLCLQILNKIIQPLIRQRLQRGAQGYHD